MNNKSTKPLSIQKSSSTSLFEQTEQFNKEIAEKDAKIQELLMSLADLVVEKSRLEKENNHLTMENAQLEDQCSKMQFDNKELTTSLEITKSELNKSQNEAEELKPRLEKAFNDNHKLKNRIATLEDNESDNNKKMHQMSETDTKNKKQIEKLIKEIQYLKESHRVLKNQHTQLQENQLNLEKQNDLLLNEKNHLQNKISKLITGYSPVIEYHVSSNDITLVPKQKSSPMPISLPFCFPERLPPLIKFKRELIAKAPRCFYKSQTEVRAKIFKHKNNLRIKQSQPRIIPGNTAQFNFEVKELKHLFSEICEKKIEIIQPSNFKAIDRLYDATNEYIVNQEHKLSYVTLSSTFSVKAISYPKDARTFKVFTYSIDLLLSYLSRYIISYLSEVIDYNFCMEISKAHLELKNIDSKKIIKEKLALRQVLHLKSETMDLQRKKLSQVFEKSGGLKSLLKSFETTLDLMVRKYERPARNTETGDKK